MPSLPAMRLSLRTRILLFFIAIAAGVAGMAALALWLAHRRTGDPVVFAVLAEGAVLAVAGVCCLVAFVWYLFDRHVARPIEAIASAMRARVHAGVAREMKGGEGRYLGDLAAAAAAASARLAEDHGALAESIARETTRLSADKVRLEHLLADVPPAVLLCTGRHRLVFYNGVAQRLLSDAGRPVCLDRSLFDYLDDRAVRAAHRHLLEAGSGEAVSEFVCSTPGDGRRLAGRMRLAADNGGNEGAYVMTLRDVTAELSAFARRDALAQEIFDRLRDEPEGLDAAALAALEARFEACRAGDAPFFATRTRSDGEEPAGLREPLHSVVYDFDLLARSHPEGFARARLNELSYVVFDTETTGLLPDQGDEIVQIAAVRIVAGKRVRGETFDLLVDPGRPIPPAATAIHGVTDAMVAGAPRIVEAVERFHRFAEGSVLVAHNAPFDMAFLYRREAQIGRKFVNPVLDTVSLSAVVFGEWQDHSLDGLVERLGVELPPELRHTALGDAVATADAFLGLATVLSGRGLDRFEDVLTEVRRHGRLVRDLNGRAAS